MGVYRPKKSKFYWIDFYYKGVRYRESSESPRKRDAELLLAKRKYEVREGKFNPAPIAKEVTLSEFMPRYFEWAKDHKKPSTIERNHQFLSHLIPKFGAVAMSQISIRATDDYKKVRLAEKASNATINRERSFLKAILNRAVKWEVIDRNPIQSMESLPEQHLFNRYLSVDETLALIGSCEAHLRPMIVTAVYTGLRWGNVRRLRWDEVDAGNSIIILITSKTSELVYPLPDPVKAEILQIPQNGSPYVFVNPETGKPWANLRTAFDKAKNKAGIARPFRFHDLRHSFASNLVMAGQDLKTVQELLGHRCITTTLRYVHLNVAHKKRAVDGLFQKRDDVVSATAKKGAAR
ncbi:MAG: tyrosine-type recombinase/integrase [Desulfobacteraceae bacterium]|jgi:integrase|nr:tyrosine-type recombinase/integrase [Desulfobacteraceae bacterium]